MTVYAGIDEAGYGPLLGPMTLGCSVLAVEDVVPADDAQIPCLWTRLERAVCKEITGRRGRIAVNDSKKLHTPSAGIRHLETGALAFAHAAGIAPASLDQWLDALGESSHHDLSRSPWYAADEHHPWQKLPVSCSDGELAIARSMLRVEAERAKIRVLGMRSSVVFEDRFNQLSAAMRSKAAVSFTFVSRFLNWIWQQWGHEHPVVVVDRQSGRMHYRELLAITFPDAAMTILDETPERSAYLICESSRSHGASSSANRSCSLRVSFEVEAESRHLPVALASMVAKYNRELLMARLQKWFKEMAPHIAPTAGYAADGKRFLQQVEPLLQTWGVDPSLLRRQC